MLSRNNVLLGLVVLGIVCSSARSSFAAPVEAIDAWRDMRFGMFIHWGPSSLTGGEISWSRGRQTPAAEYDELYKRFNPTEFDADQWVAVAKNTGMKYLVLTTKHHDGFCLWPSQYTDYDIASSPFKRDIVKELAEACEKQGIRFGIYYSVADWVHPDFPSKGPGVENPEANLPRYIDYLRNQLTELLGNYGPICTIWFDGPKGNSDLTVPTEMLIRKLQPDIMINDRLGVNYHSDFSTPEQKVGEFMRDRPWETCMTLGCRWAWFPEDGLKLAKDGVRSLLRTIGGDGNFLFNVGPMPDGRIEPRQVERLAEMGDWIKKHQDAIYGTRGGPFKPGEWGVSTCKDHTINLFVMEWSTDGTLRLPAIEQSVIQAVTKGGAKVDFEQTEEHLLLSIGYNRSDPIATVVTLTVSGQAVNITAKDVSYTRGTSLAKGKAVTASNTYGNMLDVHGPQKLVDGDPQSRWAAHQSADPVWVEIDLGTPTSIGRLWVDERDWNRVQRFTLEAQGLDEIWKTVLEGTTIGADFSANFKPVIAQKVRLNILESSDGASLWEIELF